MTDPIYEYNMPFSRLNPGGRARVIVEGEHWHLKPGGPRRTRGLDKVWTTPRKAFYYQWKGHLAKHTSGRVLPTCGDPECVRPGWDHCLITSDRETCPKGHVLLDTGSYVVRGYVYCSKCRNLRRSERDGDLV